MEAYTNEMDSNFLFKIKCLKAHVSTKLNNQNFCHVLSQFTLFSFGHISYLGGPRYTCISSKFATIFLNLTMLLFEFTELYHRVASVPVSLSGKPRLESIWNMSVVPSLRTGENMLRMFPSTNQLMLHNLKGLKTSLNC
jgi:hypothetical protein